MLALEIYYSHSAVIFVDFHMHKDMTNQEKHENWSDVSLSFGCHFFLSANVSMAP